MLRMTYHFGRYIPSCCLHSLWCFLLRSIYLYLYLLSFWSLAVLLIQLSEKYINTPIIKWKNISFWIVIFLWRKRLLQKSKILSNRPLLSSSVPRIKCANYVCLYDVIYQIEGIACIPALLTIIKRLSDRHCAG